MISKIFQKRLKSKYVGESGVGMYSSNFGALLSISFVKTVLITMEKKEKIIEVVKTKFSPLLLHSPLLTLR